MNGEIGWQRRRAWLPIKLEGRWVWLRHFDERGYKVFVERRRPITRRLDRTRLIVWSTLILLTVLFWTLAIIGAVTVLTDAPRLSVWSALERPLPCAR
jgi:hypothetical protein